MINEYLNYQAQNVRRSPHTLRANAADLQEFAAWARGNLAAARWSTITQIDVETYVKALSNAGKSASTIQRKVSCLRCFYRWAQRHGHETGNPAQYVQTPRPGKRVPFTMPYGDIRAAIEDTQTDAQTRGQIAVIAETGLRISEVLGMRWENINREARIIHVTGKGNKQRVVVYGERTEAALNGQGAKLYGDVWETASERDTRYKIAAALRAHTSAKKASPHIIRHSFACEHLNSGTEIETLSVMLGHESVKTTEIYAQVAGARLLQSFNNIKV